MKAVRCPFLECFLTRFECARLLAPLSLIQRVSFPFSYGSPVPCERTTFYPYLLFAFLPIHPAARRALAHTPSISAPYLVTLY